MSLTSFSQTDTVIKDSIVVLSSRVAKLVVKDLIAYDATKLELKVTHDLLLNTEKKVFTQSAIINQYEIKDRNYKEIITNYDLQILAYKGMTNDLKKDLKKSKLKLIYNKLGLTVGLAAVSYLYITK